MHMYIIYMISTANMGKAVRVQMFECWIRNPLFNMTMVT
jgi:hypothetical protein